MRRSLPWLLIELVLVGEGRLFLLAGWLAGWLVGWAAQAGQGGLHYVGLAGELVGLWAGGVVVVPCRGDLVICVCGTVWMPVRVAGCGWKRCRRGSARSWSSDLLAKATPAECRS